MEIINNSRILGFSNIKSKLKKFFTIRNITLMAMLTAISIVLYMLKSPLPIFPNFLELQFSEVALLLGGFILGLPGAITITILRFLIKLPFTSTAFVGEIADLILGLALVVPTILVYNKIKNIYQNKIFNTNSNHNDLVIVKNNHNILISIDINKQKAQVVQLQQLPLIKLFFAAIFGVIVGVISVCFFAIVINKLFLIDAYVALYIPDLEPEYRWDKFLNWFRGLYPNITKDTFYDYYLWLAILPFNAIKFGLCAIIAILLYKPLMMVYALKISTNSHNILAEPIISEKYTNTEIDKIFAENLLQQATDTKYSTIATRHDTTDII